MYVPSNIWPEMKEKLVAATEGLTMGCVTDPTNLVNAVIDGSSFKNIVSYIEHAKAAGEHTTLPPSLSPPRHRHRLTHTHCTCHPLHPDDCTIIAGGSYDDSKGWFVRPTIIETTNPNTKSMAEEIFGPVLTVYVYDPADFEETLKLCDATSPYALTGSIFATDVDAISTANSALWYVCTSTHASAELLSLSLTTSLYPTYPGTPVATFTSTTSRREASSASSHLVAHA